MSKTTTITPAWEDKELVWAPNPPNSEGNGFIYASIQTGANLLDQYRGKTYEQIGSVLEDEFTEAANNIVRRVFTIDDERFGSEIESLVDQTKSRLLIDDIDIRATNCEQNTILFRISFKDVISSSADFQSRGLDYEQSSKLLWGLKNTLATNPLFGIGRGEEVDLLDLFDDEEPTPDDVNNLSKDKQKESTTKSDLGTKKSGATGVKTQEQKERQPSIPERLSPALSGSGAPESSSEIMSNSERVSEDISLEEDTDLFEDLNKRNYAPSSIFVGDDPYRSKLTARIDRRVQSRFNTIEKAFDNFLDEFDVVKFACQAAACFGVELPVEESERIFLLSIIKSLSCEDTVDVLDVMFRRTGLNLTDDVDTSADPGPPGDSAVAQAGAALVDVRDDILGTSRTPRADYNRTLAELNDVVINKATKPVIGKISIVKIRQMLDYLGSGIILIDEDLPVENDFSPVADQEVEDIIESLNALPVNEVWEFYQKFDLQRDVLLKACEIDKFGRDKEKNHIVEHIKSIDNVEKESRGRVEPENSNVLLKSAITDVTRIPLPQIELIQNCDYWKFIGQFIPRLPRIPTIRIPDIFPTIDQLGPFVDNLAEAMFIAVETALVSMVEAVIDAVRRACDQGELGGLNIGGVIADSAKTIGEREANNIKNELIRSIKNVSEVDDVIESYADSFEPLLESISNNLKPIDVFELLLGSASENVIDSVDCAMSANPDFNKFKSALNTPDKISNFFGSVGNRIVDKNILLNSLMQATEPRSPSGKQLQLGCQSPQEEIELNELLGAGVPQDEAIKQVERARNRRRQRLSDLADIINNGNILDQAMPPDDPCRENGPSLTRDPPVIENILSRTIDSLYDGPYIFFNQEVDNFKDNIIVSIEEEELIPYRVDSKNDEGKMKKVLNPRIRQLIGSGVDIDGVDVVSGDSPSGSFSGSVLVRKVAPELKGRFQTLENNEELYTSGLGTYTLIVPPDSVELESFSENSEGLAAAATTAPALGELAASAPPATQNLPKTKEPLNIVYEEIPTSDDGAERYSLDISSDSSILLAFDTSSSVSQEVRDIRGSFTDANKYAPRIDFANMLKQTLINSASADPVGANALTGLFIENHSNIFNDVISMISRETSTSTYFNEQILSLVDFAPELTREQIRAGCGDPHLLDISKTKDDVKKDYKEARCKKDPTENAAVSNTLGEFESAGIGGAIRTIIRLYIVDLCLRGIFPLSKFRFDEQKETDELIRSFFARYIANEIKNLDPKYSEDFQKQATYYHNNKASEFGWQRTNRAEDAIKDIVSLEFGPVASRISDMLGNKEAESKIEDRVLNDFLPLYDVQGSRTENRFDTLPNSISGKEQTFTVENGNFILERYANVNFKILPSGINPWDRGLMKLDKLTDYMRTRAEDDPTQISDIFDGPVKMGLRLTYVMPADIDIRQIVAPSLRVAEARLKTAEDRYAEVQNDISKYGGRDDSLEARAVLETYLSGRGTGDNPEPEKLELINNYLAVNGVPENVTSLVGAGFRAQIFGNAASETFKSFSNQQIRDKVWAWYTSRRGVAVNLAAKITRTIFRIVPPPPTRSIQGAELAMKFSQALFDAVQRSLGIDGLTGPAEVTIGNEIVNIEEYRSGLVQEVEVPNERFNFAFSGPMIIWGPSDVTRSTNFDPVVVQENLDGGKEELEELSQEISNLQDEVIRLNQLIINEETRQEQFDRLGISRATSIEQKAYQLEEKELESDNIRKIFTIPLFSEEIDLSSGRRTMGELRENVLSRTQRTDPELVDALRNRPEFKFVFDYCVPLDRITFLVVAYSVAYFAHKEVLRDLFTVTRGSLKTIFYSLLNAADPDYVDETQPGNRESQLAAQNNNSQSSFAPLIAALVFKTPIRILKGLVEITDPNIILAKRIKDAAMLADKNIPMPLASLAALPMNVIPPPPIGPGIGPPITPLGLVYLAVDANSAVKTSEEKKFEQEQARKDVDGPTPPTVSCDLEGEE